LQSKCAGKLKANGCLSFWAYYHRFRRSALVESAPRRGHVDLADSMVRVVLNPGDHSGFRLRVYRQSLR
jgi:hypothetical protein